MIYFIKLYYFKVTIIYFKIIVILLEKILNKFNQLILILLINYFVI